MPKFFQHINPASPDFEKVTILKYIDDSDPDLLIYVFADGTKCNKDFIANVNDNSAFITHKLMAEISSDRNRWRFIKKETESNLKGIASVTGESYTVPNEYMTDDKLDIMKWEVIFPRQENVISEDLASYYLSNKENNTETRVDNNVSKPNVTVEHDNNIKVEPLVKKEILHENKITDNNIMINTKSTPDNYMNNDININKLSPAIQHIIIDDVKYTLSEFKDIFNKGKHIDNMLTNANNSNNDVLISECDDSQIKLIDNMINMSKKVEGEIDIAIHVNLPAKDVFKLVTSVYPSIMADEFIVNIANSISVHDLRQAVASGLEDYYDNEYSDTIIEETEQSVNTSNVYKYKAESVESEQYQPTVIPTTINKKPRTKRYK